MLQTTLLVLIALGVGVIGVLQHKHRQWVKREFGKNLMAHTRIVKQLPVPRHEPFLLTPCDRKRTTVWPYRQPEQEPEDWNDDFPRTGLFGVLD